MADSGQLSQTFAFVAVNDENRNVAPTKAMRAHAMRDSIRRKRLGTSSTAPGKQVPYRTGRFKLSSSPAKVRGEPLEATTPASGSVLDIFENSLEEAYDLDQRLYHDQNRFTSVPSRGRIDPFNTSPIVLGPRQQMLLSYCEYYSSHSSTFLSLVFSPNSLIRI